MKTPFGRGALTLAILAGACLRPSITVAQTPGSMRARGLNQDGQLGDGTTTLRTAPVAVTGLSSVLAEIPRAGRKDSCQLP